MLVLCHEQETQDATGMADTPYAQASPLPSWMLDPRLQQDTSGTDPGPSSATQSAAPERPRTRSQRQESAPAQAAQPGSSGAAAPPASQPIGADALNQALGLAMGSAGQSAPPAAQHGQATSTQGPPASLPQLGNVAERVAGLSGSVPRWASGSLDAQQLPAPSAAAAAAAPVGQIGADLFSSAMSAAMSSIGQAPQQQQVSLPLGMEASDLTCL